MIHSSHNMCRAHPACDLCDLESSIETTKLKMSDKSYTEVTTFSARFSKMSELHCSDA